MKMLNATLLFSAFIALGSTTDMSCKQCVQTSFTKVVEGLTDKILKGCKDELVNCNSTLNMTCGKITVKLEDVGSVEFSTCVDASDCEKDGLTCDTSVAKFADYDSDVYNVLKNYTTDHADNTTCSIDSCCEDTKQSCEPVVIVDDNGAMSLVTSFTVLILSLLTTNMF